MKRIHYGFDREYALQAIDAVSAFLSELQHSEFAYEHSDSIAAMQRELEHFYQELVEYPMSILDGNPKELFWKPLENMLGSCLAYLRK